MQRTIGISRTDTLLRVIIALYCGARLGQLWADRLPLLLTVILHVIPPALFAVLHGRVLYGSKRFAAFAVSCLGIGALSETLSLRTGIPFGSYFFTAVMGPRMFDLPVLLVLAYLGLAYCSWTLALLLLKETNQPLKTPHLLLAPLLASTVFLAWDLAMEPDWATVDRAWIWRHGGAYFGVPISNFAGWFLTAWLFFLVFAVYIRKNPAEVSCHSRTFWRYPVVLYGVCAAGNLLIPFHPMAPSVVKDATGKSWHTQAILRADSAASILVMGAFAASAWFRSSHYSRSVKSPYPQTSLSR